MKKLVRTLKNEKGITLVVVILIAMGVAMLAFGAIALNVNLNEIISKRKNIKRIYVVRDALTNYYKSHGYLPTASDTDYRVPVEVLGLEQKYRLDENGQYYYYSVDNPTTSPITSTTTNINGIMLDRDLGEPDRYFTAIIVGPGSDQTFQSVTSPTASQTVFSDDAWNDDVYAEVNLQAIAEEITISELTLLAKKVWAYRCANNGIYPPSPADNASDTIINYFSLNDTYRTDAWLENYAWDGTKFYSNGSYVLEPDNKFARVIKVPELTMDCPDPTLLPPSAPSQQTPDLPDQPITTNNINGDGGNDRGLFGSLYGTSQNDRIRGFGGNDWLFGLDGDDRLLGGSGNDLLHGGQGDDWLQGQAGDDILRGDFFTGAIGIGNDVLYGGAGSDRVSGENGDDFLFGQGGIDYLYGGDGNDWLLGGGGNDVMRGDSQWVMDLFPPIDPYAYRDTDIISGLPLSGEDYMSGGNGADEMYGGLNNDTIYGDGGWDYIEGNEGDDLLVGENGNDEIHGNDGNDEIFGGNHDDDIYGDEGDDIISGDDGADDISGGDGEDEIYGGDGDDILNGDDGDDEIYGDNGVDTISGGADNDMLYGGVNPLFVGGDTDTFGDIINGNDGLDTIIGAAGDDTLSGDADNDTIFGGDGEDVISGGNDNDTIYGDVGNDELYGDAGKDYIYAGEGDDQLFGGDDNDTLYPGPGSDTITGGSGGDTAVFSGNIGDYTKTQSTVSGGPDGTNSIDGSVEYYMFDDGIRRDKTNYPL